MKKKIQWIVRLGESEWARHTYPRPPGDSLRLLGSVRRGPQMGALAETLQGKYVQVVGDFVVALKHHPIDQAIKAAERFGYAQPKGSMNMPVVVIKRRRIPVTDGT
jgi:hypothetical protein